MTRDEPPHEKESSQGSGATSRSLLDQLKANQAEAWDRLVLLYGPLIYHWCKKTKLPAQEIADVMQEVLQAIATHIQQFKKERPEDTFRGWIRTITRNKIYDYHRKRTRQPSAAGGTQAQMRLLQLVAFPEEDDEDQDDNQAYDQLFQRALQLIRGDFQERTWMAFWRVVVDGQTPRDVAEELSMRVGTVRVAKSRVLHRLRRELGDLLD